MTAVTLAAGHNAVKQIVIVGDGQTVGWQLDDKERWKTLRRVFSSLKTQPIITWRTLPLPTSIRNLAVASIRPSRDIVGTDREVGLAVTVVNGEVTEDGVVFDLPYNGLRLSFPPEFEDMKGVVYRTGDGKMQDRDLYYTNFLYFGLSPEEWEERMDLARRSQELTKEELERYEYLDGQDAFLPGFLCGKDESEVESFVQYSAELGAPFASVTKIGEANGYIYYCFEDEETRIEHLKPEYVEEYRKIVEAIKEAGTKAEFSVPTEPEDPWIGKVLQFAPQSSDALVIWVSRRFGALSKRIARSDAEYLIEITGEIMAPLLSTNTLVGR